MATQDLLKIKVFWSKAYNAIISAHDVTSKILARDSNYVVDLVIWPKFVSPIISMNEVIITRAL